ncbi:MAG: TetR/AcrR family transcriptional regulator [Pseudomonadota bacterium]
MARKTDARRADLKAKLIDLAETQIAAQGVTSLRARDLAKEAGCSVGAIYTHFSDLTDLALEVNLRTFKRLGGDIAAALDAAGPDPLKRLKAMSFAYLGFARENWLIWRAMFDIGIDEGRSTPDWYQDALVDLLAPINAAVEDLSPDEPPEQTRLFANALFSSVHGIVLLGLDRATSGVPEAALEPMIEMLLTRIYKIS